MHCKTRLVFLLFFLVSLSCSKKQDAKNSEATKIPEKKVSSTKKLSKINKSNYDLSKLKSVCDCYDKALDVLDKAEVERKNYTTKEKFNKNKESVKIVNKLIEDWKTIRTYCLMTYQRAMYMENDCVYPIDIIEKKRDKLYKLGLDT